MARRPVTTPIRTPETWEAEYRRAFVEHAVSRGWEEENAKDWADDLADEARIAQPGRAPAEVAQEDVVEVENDDSHA